MNLILIIAMLIILTKWAVSRDEPVFHERVISTTWVGDIHLHKIERIYQSGRILIYYRIV